MIDDSFALTLGGLVFPGFSDSAGVCDTSKVIAVINASGVRAYEPSRRSAWSARPIEPRLHSGATRSESDSIVLDLLRRVR